MRLPILLRLLLKPVVRPIREAIDRRVTAPIATRLSEYQNRLELPSSGDSPQNPPSQLIYAPLLAPVDKYLHPKPDRLWVILRDLDNAKLTIKSLAMNWAGHSPAPYRPALVSRLDMSACIARLPPKPISRVTGPPGARGWMDTNQHASSLDNVFQPHLVASGFACTCFGVIVRKGEKQAALAC